MISKECEPTLAWISAVKDAAEIARNASFGDLKAELHQFAMNVGRSPTGILVCQAADQITNLAREFRPASLGTRSPRQYSRKPARSQPITGIRLHDQEDVFQPGQKRRSVIQNRRSDPVS